ncbi:MAG: hypothetical protein WKF78_05765 [Candidatus Limnocylindrales bacterium]
MAGGPRSRPDDGQGTVRPGPRRADPHPGALTPGDATTLAQFTDATTASGSIATDTLAAPTGVAATGGASIALSWTSTVDAYASGYQLLRSATDGGGHAVAPTITPATTAATTDAPGTGTWYYLMRSVYQSWLSVPTAQGSATVSASVTSALAACTTTAADTSGAGDNDGYQNSSARACGTGSCGTGATPAATKDRHRFRGFAHGVPGTATTIEGIAVRVDLGTNNNGGNTNICAQLSWNGGTTWTTISPWP